MGEVIPLFREEPTPEERFVVEDIITDEMADSIVDTIGACNELWEAASKAELLAKFRVIKATVERWPG